jgi:hypothetical protein
MTYDSRVTVNLRECTYQEGKRSMLVFAKPGRSLRRVYEQEHQRSDIGAAYPSGLPYGCGKLGWDYMQRISLPLRFTCKSRQNRRADERTRNAYPCSSYECAVTGCSALQGVANPA